MALTAILGDVVGGTPAPNEGHTLRPGPCDYVRLHPKRGWKLSVERWLLVS